VTGLDGRRDPRLAFLIGVAIIASAGLLDYLTPADVDLSELYLLGVVVVAWSVGWPAGIAFALLAASTELAVDTALRAPSQSVAIAVALWNGLSDFSVLAVLAFAVDRVRRERRRWAQVDAERARLLRVLDHELPRPLRAISWFARTFEEALDRAQIDTVRTQFATLRHHVREASFLATDLLAVGHIRADGITFDRRPISLNVLVAEAAEDSLHRSRVFPSLSADDPRVLADPDRLRHAVGSLIGRYLELSPYEPVTVLTRSSAGEAVIEIGCRAGTLDPADTELAELLVAGNGGRFMVVGRGPERGSLASLYLPSAPAATPVRDAATDAAAR
jgi:signal transduction histidine kinase